MLFLVALFLIKNISVFKKSINTVLNKTENGLSYDMTVGELVYKDNDGDGVPDWEEGLYGLDPARKETTPGIPDSTAFAKLRPAQGDELVANGTNPPSDENLTETEKFSRELFSSTAALGQTGEMDQNTADQITGSLASKIQNAAPRKVFILSDIKVINNDTVKTIKTYNDALDNIATKYPITANVTEVFQKFIIDENNVDVSALLELDPIIKQMQNRINEVVKISTPQSLASLHLDFLNKLEEVMENLSDITFYDTDPIVALKGISQYQTNIDSLQAILVNLTNTINQKLKN